MLSQHEDLYIPHDERTLRRVQRKVDELDRQVRAWADLVVEVLPKGLAFTEAEYDLLALYLAQQRRRNLELDEQNGKEPLRTRLARYVPFLSHDEDEWEIANAAHRMVSTRLEADIDRATDFFCRDNGLPGLVEPVIDWRVAVRYLAQRVHHIACQLDLRHELATSPLRFELALTARDLAADVVDNRRVMFALFEPAETS
ncbi:MAG TPA: hypothetical protein VJN32_00425 [Dehalococcoidia bacterium]|nr:hypothetical protein [Dehalococcoidia bacterium]